MRTIITGCSRTIAVNLAIPYKKIEKQWGNKLFFEIKHKFGEFKRIDLEKI